MFLKRIQVPNFRVLKYVDLTFEPEFSPRIFPLGSLNGGGKSTLLQLIFILLSCSGDSDKHIFIQNILKDFKVQKPSFLRPLATIYLEDNKNFSLEFLCVNDLFLAPISEKNSSHFDQKNYRFAIYSDIQQLEKKVKISESRIQHLSNQLKRIEIIETIENKEERNISLKKEIDKINHGELFAFIRKLFKIKANTITQDASLSEIRELKEEIKDRIKQGEDATIKDGLTIDEFKKNAVEIDNFLEVNKFVYICDDNLENKQEDNFSLLCRVDNIDLSEGKDFLNKVSSKVFLAAPLSQVFTFLSLEDIKLLLKNNQLGYFRKLENAKNLLPNFYTYNLLDVDLIMKSAQNAVNKDLKQVAISGEYGNQYKQLLAELNSILDSKKINPNLEKSEVNFTIQKDGIIQELYPEDLSHGELKRLSIYMWLKYHEMQDCIVLIDEIENAFHPDWQYQIISDLAEWGASNQYILATHSYELCQALTPAHVKELEPKLISEKQVEN